MSELAAKAEGERVRSLDAYRGFVMLAMASGGLGLAAVARHFPESRLWQTLGYHFDHVTWRGCAFWDLIQPSFMFIVGVAMPFSYASRRAQGQPWSRLLAHALWRSLILIALAIFLSSTGSDRTNFVFVNVLAQIGLGYTFVFLTLGRRPTVQWAVAIAILVGYWALFAAYPLPASEAAYAEAGLPADWDRLSGFAAHWEKNTNAAAAFDRWFLNLFPQPGGKPFRFNEGGYTTLNFVPSIATMLFGVLAGELLRSTRSARAKLGTLLVAGLAGLALGTALDATVCPVVKRIWTPSWVVYSTGWTCLLLAAFYGVIDVAGLRRWSFPMIVVGANSIAMYVMAQLLKPFIARSLKIHLGPHIFEARSGPIAYDPIVQSAAVLLVLWLICLWLYRQRIFLKI